MADFAPAVLVKLRAIAERLRAFRDGHTEPPSDVAILNDAIEKIDQLCCDVRKRPSIDDVSKLITTLGKIAQLIKDLFYPGL